MPRSQTAGLAEKRRCDRLRFLSNAPKTGFYATFEEFKTVYDSGPPDGRNMKELKQTERSPRARFSKLKWTFIKTPHHVRLYKLRRHDDEEQEVLILLEIGSRRGLTTSEP